MAVDWTNQVTVLLYVAFSYTGVTSFTDDVDVTVHTKYGPIRGSRVTENYELGHGKLIIVF